MADEANDSNRPNTRSNMDLNLYLGLPRSPRRARPDLGSDLALSSIPMNSSSSSSVASIEDSNTPANRSSSIHIETAESQAHPPYSPSTPAMDPNPQMDHTPPSPEYTPYFPSYESFNTSYPPLVDPNPLPPVHELDEATNPSLMIVDDPTAFSAETHVPYSPPYVAPPSLPPVPPPQQAYIPHPRAQENPNDNIPFSFYPQLPPPYMTSGRAELLRPELRFRRLIETSSRLRARRFRSSFSHGSGANNPNMASASTIGVTAAELQAGQETVACVERTAEANVRKDKVKLEAGTMEEEASDEESKENAQNISANFECNVCFEMATEPVVTSCGHLFCWPCLYQWLHVHSDHRECPVCKGEVTDANITPIYGRGGSDSNGERAKSTAPIGEDGVKIPPRPRGNRVESFRQQFRPVSRRFGEGIASSMRRLLDPQIRPGASGSHRFDPNVDAAMQEVLDGAHRRVLTRLRARRLQREEFNIGTNSSSSAEVIPNVMVDTTINSGPPLMNPGSSSANPNPNSATLFREGIDLWHRFSLYGLASTERLAAITADLGRVVGRFASMNGTNNNGASTSASPMDPSSSERPASGDQVAAALAADQVSASSTMAVIQGDPGAATGNSEGPASASERRNSSVGSSRAQRRRVRTGGNGTAGASTSGGSGNTGGSLDVDGGPAHHLRKRRRLN